MAQVSFGGHGQGKIHCPDTGGHGNEEEEQQQPRKKRPGVSDSLTLVGINHLSNE